MTKRDYKWYKLDNAATIIPSSARGADTRVFRMVCELTENVEEETLQSALDMALEEFPHFNVILKRGLFWYYLDSTSMTPEVTEDSLPECAALYHPGRRELLYRVTYFNKRINLEMFHVLADGTGAMAFMKTILTYYLQLQHKLELNIYHPTTSTVKEKGDDAFRLFFEKEDSASISGKFKVTRAYHIRQERDGSLRNHLIEGTVEASRFMAMAKAHGQTAGVMSVAIFIQSIIETMPKSSKKLPVVISVPVNLRQFFHSETTRNFFGVIYVSYNPGKYDGTLESIIPDVQECFREGLKPANVKRTMNGYSSLERNFIVKMIPLFIKEPVIHRFYRHTKMGVTATVSNLGKISVPEAMVPYIDSFSTFMSTSDIQITIATFGDKMTFGVVSAYTEQKVMVNFFRKLSSYGIDVVIGTNDNDN